MQRELPWRLLADVAYVGNTMRNAFAVNAGQSYTNQLNDPDPTAGRQSHAEHDRSDDRQRAADQLHPAQLSGPRREFTQRVFLDELYRDYNAIQFEIRRRLANGFAWAANYTGSVTKQYAAYDWYRTRRGERGPEHAQQRGTGSRPHNAKFTYNWMIPGPSRFLGNNVIAKGFLDGWQLSGITTMLGGTWSNFYATTSPAHRVSTALTGGLGGSRVIIVCDPNLPRGERTFERQYRTECVRPPGPRTDPNDTLYQGTGIGEGQEDARMGLGYINHDLTLFKNFSLGNGRNLQVRAEVYNAFNTTQYPGREHRRDVRLRDRSSRRTRPSAPSTPAGVRANSNRVIQLGVRLTF